MAPVPVYIRCDGTLRAAEVTLDGQRVEHCISGLTVDMQAREIPTVTLDVIAVPIEVDGVATVKIPDVTHQALVALGWAPPEDDRLHRVVGADWYREAEAVQVGYHGRCRRCGELADHSSRGTVEEALRDAEDCPCREDEGGVLETAQ